MKINLSLVFVILSMSVLAEAKYNDFVISLPVIAMGGEAQAKFEYNLDGIGGLGLEVLLTQEGEEYTDDEVLEKGGDSLLMKGSELALTYSVYSNNKKMSGGYWTFGLGYRQMQADWSRGPTDDFAPTGVALNKEGKFKHEVVGVGLSAHGRVGYRYIPDAVPVIGAYIGLRHFANQFKDRDSNEAVETPQRT